MKILINSAHQRFGGAIQVALSFLNECRNFKEHEYYVCVGPGVRKSINEDDFPQNFTFEYFDFGVINFFTTFEINKTLKSVELRVQPDAIISTSGPTYFHSKAPQVIGFNLPLYIYPESPYLRSQSMIKRAIRSLKKRMHFYYFKRDAAYYVVQTMDVNQRVRAALVTTKVKTVTNNASAYYLSPVKFPAKLPSRQEGKYRFLTLTSFYGHKNMDIIPIVAKLLRDRGYPQVEFVLTLKQEDFDTHIGDSPGIKNVGPVKPEECPSLYLECDAMFLPTLAECFSASYPEAMIMNKPIITTDLGFARSICGDAALYFKPKNAESAANEIERLIQNKELSRKLVENGREELKKFDSPEERAIKYIELCDSLVHGTTI